jgi:hypothetical protein
MNEQTPTPVLFEKAVLFSPAVAVRPRAHAVLLLNSLLRDTSIINSVSPASYRARRGTSLAAYKALFELERRLDAANFRNNNIPTLIIIDPQDEFISINKLRGKITRFGLSRWEILEVSNSLSSLHPPYHHLIIDSNGVSPETWEEIAGALLRFFF